MPPKKGKKAKKEGGEGGGSAGKKAEEEKRNIEYYQLKMQDMNEKMERMRLKVDVLTQENATLAKAQSKFQSDKQDIVEFLNIKVTDHEKMISALEARNKVLEDEKQVIEDKCKSQLESLYTTSQQEIDNLTFLCGKLKTDLNALSSFSAQRDELSLQLDQTKAVLEKKEQEYKETIHVLERKILQDKSQMKREMLQKVNEAVANFRKVADQQMAETTKRAIRENMSISSQLKKMSQKTTEFISENDRLKETVAQLKRQNHLLSENEKELAKKSNANQKVIKMLVEKLKESDQMLELAFEEGGNQKSKNGDDDVLDENYNPFAPPPGQENDNQPKPVILTQEMIEEIQVLQDDYNELVERMTSVNALGQDLQFLLDEAENAIKSNNEEIVLDYIYTNLNNVMKKLSDLTTFDDVTQSQNTVPSGDSEMNQAFRENDFEDFENGSEEIEAAYPPKSSNTELDQETSQEILDDQEFEDEHSAEFDTQPSSAQSFRAIMGTAPAFANRFHIHQSKYQKKVQTNFIDMIAPTTNFKKYSIPSVDGDSAVVHRHGRKMRHAGVQTSFTQFGPSVNTKILLGEIRPWGKKAQFLPQKGYGLYYARNPRPRNVSLPEKIFGTGPSGNSLSRGKAKPEKNLSDQNPIMVTNSKPVVKT